MKEKYIKAHMKAASVYAELSTAQRLQVGCVIVKNDTIIGIGYNGMPSGWDNNCEQIVQHSDDTVELKTKDEVIHAEANAISKLAKSGDSGNGAYLFCTHAPCIHCAKIVYGAGISKVFYRDSYRDDSGIDFLTKCNIEVTKT